MIEQKKNTFEETLSKAYDHERYLGFLGELLTNIHWVAPEKEVKPYNTFSAAIANYRHLGNYTGDDGNKVALFSVCLINDKNLSNARSMQRSFVKSLLESSNCAGALVAFYTEGELDKWRLSLVRMDYEFSKGKISEKLTPAKRYSYLVGDKEPCHTAMERLFPIFASDERNPSLDELEEAFSVEAVTDEFFRQYRDKYLDLKEYLDSNASFVAEAKSRGFDSEQFAKKLMGQIVFLYFIQKKGWLGVNAFPATLKEREYKDAFYHRGQKPKELMPYVYKPMGNGMYRMDYAAFRTLSPEDESTLSTLVKGDNWGDGPKDFMRKIFEGCVEVDKNFFDDYLEPLFYTGLNQNRGENAFFPPLHRRIPFLNGGLFEEMEGYDWQNNDFCIPNEIFSNVDAKGRDADGILDIFDRFNFTMAEDEPMEREVAIDPEMLGKVFENLLDVSDRKSKGAFYTPREIVHYMCQESLISYLSGKTGISDDDIRKFVLYGEYFRDEDIRKTLRVDNETGKILDGDEKYSSSHKYHMEFDKEKDLEIPESILSYKNNVNRLQELDDLLANVKVVDPAVGSGAFPLGMITEIVKARETVTTYMTIEMNPRQRLSFRSGRNAYWMKRQTIKNSIYGCDIEASATDIAKLRLWLSLVIDNFVMDQENEELGYSTKPRELPNLDCNIICGNSLMDEFCGIPLITESSVLGNESENRNASVFDQKLDIMINDLIDLQSKLYDEKEHVAKESLKVQIQDIYDEIVMEQIQGNPDVMDKYYQAIQRPSKPFVLWQLYFPKVFRDNGGFDIVIGNPPYGLINKKQNQNTSIKATPEEIKFYKTNDMYKAAKGGMINIFRLFICKSHNLLRQNGHLSLIFPMAFMCDLSAYELRKFLFENSVINYIEAFPERDNENKRVFKSAKMSVCILGSTKRKEVGVPFKLRINDDKFVNESYERVDILPSEIEEIDAKALTIPLVNSQELAMLVKVCRNSKRMKDFSKCYTGEIDLSLDKKYVQLDKTYHRMLRGAQVQKFYLTDKISQGDVFYLDSDEYLANVHTPRSQHYLQRRIVMQGITGINEKYRLKMTLAEEGVFCANSVNYLLVENEAEYILGLCNSHLLNWFFKKLSTNSNVNGYEVDNLPIKWPPKEYRTEIAEIVTKLLEAGEDAIDVKCMEERLNACVYKIYGLEEAEIEAIERAYKN